MYEFTAKHRNKYYIDLGDGTDITVYDSDESRVGSVMKMHVNAYTTIGSCLLTSIFSTLS